MLIATLNCQETMKNCAQVVQPSQSVAKAFIPAGGHNSFER